MAALLGAMERQTEAITALAQKGTMADPSPLTWPGSEESCLLSRMLGARGAHALESLERELGA